MKAFARAVAAGTVVGAGPALGFTVLFALASLPDGINGPGSLWQTLYLAALPLIVTVPFVLGASILIGLPLAYALIRSGHEQGSVCAIFGAALPVAILWMAGDAAGYWLAVPGMLSGTATAWSWWRDRKRALTETDSPSPAPPPRRPDRS